MNPGPAGDDAQRELERRALANVSALAHRLGYRDKLHIRSEKKFVLAAGIGVAVVVAVLAASAMLQSSREDETLAMRRCSVDVWQQRVESVRDEIRRTRPDLSARERADMVGDRMRDLTLAKCGR